MSNAQIYGGPSSIGLGTSTNSDPQYPKRRGRSGCSPSVSDYQQRRAWDMLWQGPCPLQNIGALQLWPSATMRGARCPSCRPGFICPSSSDQQLYHHAIPRILLPPQANGGHSLQRATAGNALLLSPPNMDFRQQQELIAKLPIHLMLGPRSCLLLSVKAYLYVCFY